MEKFKVENSEELLKALEESKSGDTIILQPGVYDWPDLPLKEGVVIKGTAPKLRNMGKELKQRPLPDISDCEARQRVLNGLYADPYDE